MAKLTIMHAPANHCDIAGARQDRELSFSIGKSNEMLWPGNSIAHGTPREAEL